MILDWQEELRKLLREAYCSPEEATQAQGVSTAEVVQLLSAVIPSGALDEHEVYEALKALGHKPKLIDEQYLWYLQQKK